MAGEQFSLSWNEFHKNLSVGFINLFEDSSLTDVTLAVDGQKIQAHKVVLSVCSPYFKTLFNENPCQHPIVFLKDVNFSILQNLLKFMYQGEVNVSQEELADFIKTAEELQIKGLTGNGGSSNDTGQNNFPTQKYKQDIKQDYYDSFRNQNRINNRVVSQNRYRPIPYNNVQRRSVPSNFHQSLNKGTKFQVVNTPPEIKRKCQDISNLELRGMQRSDEEQQQQRLQQLQQQRLQQEQQRQIELRQQEHRQQEQREQEQLQEQQESRESPASKESESVGEPNEDGLVSNLKAEPEDYGSIDEIPLKEDGYSPDETFDESIEDPQAGTSMDVKLEGQEHVTQDDVYFIRSLRGTPMLVVGDYTFSRNKRTKSRTYWLCCKAETSKCKISCIIQDNGVIRMPRGHLHNHPNELEKILSSEIMNVSYNDISAIFTHQ